MLDRNYGKCLSNLWQIFGKKILKMAIFWQYGFFITKLQFFGNIDFISYFFRTLNFLCLTIKTRSVLWE